VSIGLRHLRKIHDIVGVAGSHLGRLLARGREEVFQKRRERPAIGVLPILVVPRNAALDPRPVVVVIVPGVPLAGNKKSYKIYLKVQENKRDDGRFNRSVLTSRRKYIYQQYFPTILFLLVYSTGQKLRNKH
jgi:hypothetical protein